MDILINIMKSIAYIISGWTILAIVVDVLNTIISRDITSVGWYASRPLAIWKLCFETGLFKGLLIWLIAIIITILTAIFLI